MKLYYREFGEQYSGTPVVLLHGLLGSLVNWQRIARSLGERYRVIVPDLRNHGRSPHSDDVSYPAMASDVLELLDDLDIPRAVPVGHSMGGKAAMVLALQHAERVERLAVVDIAPVVAYSGRLAQLLDALLALPLDRIENRAHADALLAERVSDKAVRDHMLQNLQRTDNGWCWRNNLQALRDGLDVISGFLEQAPKPYTGKCCFIKGEHSDYIKEQSLPRIRALFPAAEIVEIPAAGHWVYAEQPQAFVETLENFLS
ncbi:alpha/beta fold hydrolase [Thiolapillus sp.]|uniref:alpha/beta fold hydrolase n=3 Tax=Thiolapillus sp. TaxID=2017437 RepID=UPI0025E6659C|nr:alpha/beta fold hydrolase [Thiolapillus sp.]